MNQRITIAWTDVTNGRILDCKANIVIAVGLAL